MSQSVAVVVLDCMRQDYFNKHFDWMPGRIFSQAYSTSHWSIPSHATLMTGKYASEIGTHAKSPTLPADESTLPKILKEEGYQTRLWTQNHQLCSWDGWESGFEETITPEEIKYTGGNIFNWSDSEIVTSDGLMRFPRSIWELFFSDSDFIPSLFDGYHRYSQESILPNINRRLRKTNFTNNEFLFLNLMQMHQPYHVPERYSTTNNNIEINHLDNYRDSKLDPSVVKSAYDDCARYMSDIYKKIFNTLTNSFDLIITLADHGEHLGEHGRWSHEYGISEELVHVPLVIWSEDTTSTVCTEYVSLIDVPETIADLLSINFDSRGQTLLSDITHQDRLTEYHGVMAFQEPQFREAGLETEFDRVDVQRNGVVLSDGYAYEDEQGFCTTGNVDKKIALSKLEELRQEISWKEGDNSWMSSNNEFVDKSTRSRLEDLGYL